MPRIPDLSSLGARPAPQSRQGVASQDTTAAGRGMVQFAQTLGQISEDFQRQDDEQKTLEYRRKLIEFDKERVHDPEKGAAAKLGKDAFGLAKSLTDEFDEFSSKAAEGLTTNRQRQIAEQMRLSRRESIQAWANAHELKQRDVFDTQEYQANTLASKDNATLYPTLAPQELENMSRNTRAFLAKRGVGDEAIAAKIKADASEVHGRIISGMVKGGNAAAAEKYFIDNAASMDAASRDQAQGQLKELASLGKSQAFQDEVIFKGMSEEEALQSARERFKSDPETREKSLQQVKVLFAERNTAKAQEIKKLTGTAWDYVLAPGKSSRDIPADVWASLNSLDKEKAQDERRQIMAYEDAKWRRAKADAEGKKTEDWGTYMMLVDMANNPNTRAMFLDPQTFQKFAPLLSDGQQRSIQTMRSGISSGDAKAAQTQSMIDSTLKMIQSEVEKAGIDLTVSDKDKGTKKAERKDAFIGALRLSLEEYAATRPGTVDPKEMRRRGLELLKEGIEQGSGIIWPDKGRRFEVEAKGKTFVVAEFDDIPADIRSELIKDQFPDATGNIYRNMRPNLTAEQKKRIELLYTNGKEAGVFK